MVDHDEIVAIMQETITELSSCCKARLVDIYDGIEGWRITTYREERQENRAFIVKSLDDAKQRVEP